jgi:hypothetical protein
MFPDFSRFDQLRPRGPTNVEMPAPPGEELAKAG